MHTNEELVEVLNDLIEINNDRIKGYEKASDEAQETDIDLKAIFATLAKNSVRFARELTEQVIKLGGESATGTTNRGKIYRVWMDVKKAFATNDRLAILASCEFGEDAAQKAYEEALATDADLNVAIRQLITGQKSTLKSDHELIKKYRDAHKVVSSL